MTTRTIESWKELGQRIAEARKAAGLSQTDLGVPLGLDRSAVSRMESGDRQVDTLELSRIAVALRRPIDWFVRSSPVFVVSRRDALASASVLEEDRLLDGVGRDVQLLVDMGFLVPPAPSGSQVAFLTITDAERLAVCARDALGHSDPLPDLAAATEKLGLLAFSLARDPLDCGLAGAYRGGPATLGAYANAAGIGVAVVDGREQAARRRFALAHELGHHLLLDDLDVLSATPVSRTDREKLVDAFAIHFLMPRKSVVPIWTRLVVDEESARDAAIVLGHEYGVNWSAVISHLLNLGLIDTGSRSRLLAAIPSGSELLERGLRVQNDLASPTLPKSYVAAVLKAFRKHKISGARTLEMLHGAVDLADLPEVDLIPVEAFELDREPLE